ncbi:MAG TPA: polyphosphate kinase 2 family protein [Puia sp.]|nr:polyphosphate kinase 2 family protein [Puia sp.]
MAELSTILEYLDDFIVKEGKTVSLKDYDTDYDHKNLSKQDGETLLQLGIKRLSELQDKFYADKRFSLLTVIQAMDAAGKDGVVKHVMNGVNPQGVKVTSFKVPTALELSHDFLWRHYLALPAKGEIGIFNRSHYENVLVTRVHPEYILKENIPGIKSTTDVTPAFWEKRYKQINHFEKTLSDNGTVIIKFMLHVSKKEQKKRFLERIENPSKNWKFSMGDVKERALWKEYRNAYDDLLSNTSMDYAPWYVIPADDKWFARLAVAAILFRTMERLNLNYPTLTEEMKADLQKGKQELMSENGKEKENNKSG